MKKITLSALVIASVALLAGCGSTGNQIPETATQPVAETAPHNNGGLSNLGGYYAGQIKPLRYGSIDLTNGEWIFPVTGINIPWTYSTSTAIQALASYANKSVPIYYTGEWYNQNANVQPTLLRCKPINWTNPYETGFFRNTYCQFKSISSESLNWQSIQPLGGISDPQYIIVKSPSP